MHTISPFRQALTDSHCREIGDYDALVIVQLAGFSEGELLLFERLQMTPMLLERYAKDGSEKARRQMLALSQSDPEVRRLQARFLESEKRFLTLTFRFVRRSWLMFLVTLLTWPVKG